MTTSFGPLEAIMTSIGIFGILLILFVPFIIWIWSLFWAYGDAETRGRSGCLLVVLCFFFWPWVLLIWLLMRPDKRNYY